MSQALEDMKVLYMSELPCPWCTMYLADLGAEVVRDRAAAVCRAPMLLNPKHTGREDEVLQCLKPQEVLKDISRR